ncbi:MAG: hypothetical protein PVS3B3_17340 [Ktedonobacteraceae bacterium]
MSLTLYGTTQAATTVTTAAKLVNATGGTSSSNTTTAPNDGSQKYMEVLGKGGTGTTVTSIPAPTAKGWLYDSTALEGFTLSGNISGVLSMDDSAGFASVDFILNAYKRSSGGTYTSFGTTTLTAQSMSSSQTSYSLPSTAITSTAFTTGDKLYYELYMHPQVSDGHWSGDPIVNFSSSSSTAGIANQFQITISGFALTAIQVDKDVAIRGRISAQVTKDVAMRGRISQKVNKDIAIRGNVGLIGKKDLALRGRISQQVSKDVGLRGRLSQQTAKDIAIRGKPANTVDKDVALRGRIAATVTKDLAIRGRLSQKVAKDLALRGRVSQQVQKDIALRGNISGPRLTSGGFTIFANGTGTATYDSVRITQYPDPSLSLAPIIPRVGATGMYYNALTPTNTTLGVDTSIDGVNWTDQTSNNGGTITGIFSQPDPTTDGFGVNSSANYTSTFRTGGSAATATFDTTNTRLILTGGTNALYVNSSINHADIDLFADLDQSDAGGLCWRYVDANNFYYLLINDNLSSTGTTNTITLYKVASNVQTQLATAAISYSVGSAGNAYTVTFTRGTYRRFRITMLKGVITAYVDGVQLLTYTDGSPLAAGLAGLYNNGGTTGSRYYQLWITPIGDVVTGNPSGDIVTGDFAYTRLRLATTDPTVTPQVEDIATLGVTPDIAMGATIPSTTYNATFLSTNFDDLAKQSNYMWYFKPDMTAVFRAMSTIAAPWILQSAPSGLASVSDIMINSDLELDVSNDLYRNRQTILGAQNTITPPAARFIGDGKATSFTLGYPVASLPAITLNGVTQTVGLKGTTGSNWYYAVNDSVIQQDSAGVVLQSTDQLIVSYTGLYDIVVIVDDVPQQTARATIEGGTGIVEAVEDHTGENMLQNEAITLAAQLINRYAIAGRTLIVDVTRDGLLVGQTLSIFFPEHGIFNGQFIIQQIEIYLKKNTGNTQVYTYKVTASELPKQQSWARLIATGLGLS